MPERFLHTLAQLTPEGVWDWFIGRPLQVLVALAIAVVVRWILVRSIARFSRLAMARAEARRARQPGRLDRGADRQAGVEHERQLQRTLAMASLLRSIVTFFVAAITGLTILTIFDIPIGPLLASAGIGGIALGFGAQSLVKDFLAGIFMILEDQYGVGDIIDTGEATGTVEEVTLRVTRLRDGAGVVWYIRNGEIIRVGNKSQGWSTALVDIPVAYSENLEKVIPLIKDVVHTMDQTPQWHDQLLEEPTVVGVESMTGNVVTIRIVAKTAAEQQYGVSREIRERVKAAFDENDVKAPVMTPFGPAGR
jgi:small conductance mechanosensitive channel